jgi:hypothetical protein
MSTALLQSRMLSGADAVRAAAKIRALKGNLASWPYPWLFPQEDALKVMQFGVIPAPVAATTTPVLIYQVPTGFNFALVGILQDFQGNGFIPGAGNALWDLLLNPGAQNLAVEGIAQVPFNYGSIANGKWWEFPAPEVFVSNDTLQSQITTTADIAAGAPNYFISQLLGFLWPSAE